MIVGGSKTVPSTDGNTSDGSSNKAPLHFVLFVIFVMSCASSLTKFWVVYRDLGPVLVLKILWLLLLSVIVFGCSPRFFFFFLFSLGILMMVIGICTFTVLLIECSIISRGYFSWSLHFYNHNLPLQLSTGIRLLFGYEDSWFRQKSILLKNKEDKQFVNSNIIWNLENCPRIGRVQFTI